MPEDFMPEKRLVQRAFARAATTYDQSAILQRTVSDRMAERLDYIHLKPTTVLDAGSGTGYGANALRQRYPQSQVIELDIALPMLLAARRKASWLSRTFKPTPAICGDIEALPLATGSVDLLWSNLALQWAGDLDAVFAEWQRVLSADGLLMFATLGPDTLRELRNAFAGVDRHTHVNQFVDMHDIGDGLIRAGFAEPVMDMEYLTLTYADVRSVMQDLKAIGAHNVTQGRPQGLMGKTRWKIALDRYEQLRQDGVLPATYEVVYGHAWKAKLKPGKLPDGRSVINFHNGRP